MVCCLPFYINLRIRSHHCLRMVKGGAGVATTTPPWRKSASADVVARWEPLLAFSSESHHPVKAGLLDSASMENATSMLPPLPAQHLSRVSSKESRKVRHAKWPAGHQGADPLATDEQQQQGVKFDVIGEGSPPRHADHLWIRSP